MADARLLNDLPCDALRHIFVHVELPYVLKLACRALRAAGPKRTHTTMARVAKSKQSLRLAHTLRFPFTWDATFASIIARGGNWDALVWANDALRIPIDHNVAYEAATSGNLAMVDWLQISHKAVFDSRKVARAAAGYGHFHIVRWLHLFGLEFGRDTLNATAEWGDFATFQWLVEVVQVVHGRDALTHAARGSGMRKNGEHMKIIEYIRRREIPYFRGWHQDAFPHSVAVAPLQMLKYMWNDGCEDPHPQLTIMYAAQYNRRDVLEWLYTDLAHLYTMDARAAWAAARNGHLELLQWMRARGCPWDYEAGIAAAQMNNVHVLRWMAANGGHIFHRSVRLDVLRRQLLHSPTGPLPDQLVPDAMWVHALMRWRKVKLLVRKWEIALFWQRAARKQV